MKVIATTLLYLLLIFSHGTLMAGQSVKGPAIDAGHVVDVIPVDRHSSVLITSQGYYLTTFPAVSLNLNAVNKVTIISEEYLDMDGHWYYQYSAITIDGEKKSYTFQIKPLLE